MSKIPRGTKEYKRCLELCIQTLPKIEKKMALNHPKSSTIISTATELLQDYRDLIVEGEKRGGK